MTFDPAFLCTSRSRGACPFLRPVSYQLVVWSHHQLYPDRDHDGECRTGRGICHRDSHRATGGAAPGKAALLGTLDGHVSILLRNPCRRSDSLKSVCTGCFDLQQPLIVAYRKACNVCTSRGTVSEGEHAGGANSPKGLWRSISGPYLQAFISCPVLSL